MVRDGYSAYWVAPALAPDGEIVLTGVDREELEQARAYFERGGYADRASFELGDALETIEDYEGPFDLVLLDHENTRYAEGFEAVREKVRRGGVVVVDNVLHSGGDSPMTPVDLDDALREGGERDPETSLGGVAAYLEHVRAREDWETTVVPVGEGVFASVRL